MDILTELGITGATALLFMLFVIGLVEMAKCFYNKEFYKAIVILTSGVAGLIAAIPLGIPIFTGICCGIAAAGGITFAQNWSKK